MTLQGRLEALAAAIRGKINAMMPRLLPDGGTAGQVLTKTSANSYDAGWATPASGGGGGTSTEDNLILTADVTSNSTTLVNISELAFQPAPNTRYRFRLYAFLQTAATAAGVQVGVNARTDYSKFAAWASSPSSATAFTTAYSMSLTAAFKAAPAASGAANVPFFGEVEGIFVTGAAPGPLNFTINSETTAIVRILADSFLTIEAIS